VSVARAADASIEVQQHQSTTQKEVINEPSGATKSYTIHSSQPSYQSYTRQTYPSGAQLDPDAENDRVMHMYQRGKTAAESLDRQIKPDPIVVWPGGMSETYRMSAAYPSSQQQTYSSTSTFNEPAAASRETTTSSGTTRVYTTREPAGSQNKNESNDSQIDNDSQKQDKPDQEKQGDQSQGQGDSSSSGVQNEGAGASTQSSEQSDALKSQPEKSAGSSADVSKEPAGAQPSSSSSSQPQSPSSSSSDVNAPSSSSSSSSLNEPSGAAPSSSATSSADTATDPLVGKVQTALKDDASLSGSAQDVKFSMENDKLVIKGTVKSEDEKNRIMEKVKATAGTTEIDDQLKVSPSSDGSSSDDK